MVCNENLAFRMVFLRLYNVFKQNTAFPCVFNDFSMDSMELIAFPLNSHGIAIDTMVDTMDSMESMETMDSMQSMGSSFYPKKKQWNPRSP